VPQRRVSFRADGIDVATKLKVHADYDLLFGYIDCNVENDGES
jgi:hypothetical protein